MATDPLKPPSGFVVYIPPNGANMIQPGQVMPGAVLPCVLQYGGQQPDWRSDPALSNPQKWLLKEFLKAETKTLGAIQIMIGLMHMGFGTISSLLQNTSYFPLATSRGYPFWGGMLFIASGSLAVSSQKYSNTNLVKCSLGFNTASAVAAFIGFFLYLIELTTNRMPFPGNPKLHSVEAIGTGLGILLLLFSFLEFGIAVLSSHFECQNSYCSSCPGVVYIPSTSAGEVTPNGYIPSAPVCGTVPCTSTGQLTPHECVPSAPIYEPVAQPTEALK